GCANLAAIAYGTAAPIEASPPDSEHIMPRRILRSRAYQLAQDPESLVMIARSGRRGDNSQATRCGLIGSAGCIARSSSVFHQSRVQPSMLLRQVWSDFSSKNGNRERKVSAASPARLTSIGYRKLDISGAISICTPRACPSLGRNSEYGKPEPIISKVSHSVIRS